MIILVPEGICSELQERARLLTPDMELLPYREEDEDIEGADEASAVLRWVAGKRYRALAEQGPHVRWLHTASAGVDHVLTPALRAKHNLIVTDSGPAFEIAISEFVLAWMLMVTRRLPQLLTLQKELRWESVVQEELYGQTVGIIGLGPIGQGVAARAKAFGMKTLGLRRQSLSVAGIDEVLTGEAGLDRLLQASDWVVLAAALTDQSRTLLGADQIIQMKPSAWLINIARGGLLDEDALIHALQEGRIGGVCLDVFAKEPLPQESPLWTMPNVFLSPHNSPGWTRGLEERQKRIFLENLLRFSRSEPLANQVDMGRGY